MKKVVLVVLVMLLALAMFAGSSADPAQPDNSETQSTQGTQEEGASKGKIGVAMPEIKNVVFNVMSKSVVETAEKAGYETIVLDANNDPQTQTTQIEDLISQGVDGILFTPVDSAALSDAVKMVNEENIPIVAMDRSVEAGDLVALIESDNVKFAYEAGVAMVEAAKEMGIEASDLKVLEIQGDLTSSAGRERSEGIQQAAEELGFTIVSSLPANWDPDKAYNAALDGLQANPDINAIFMAADSLYLQPVESVLEQREALLPVGEQGHIITAGVDGSPYAMESIRNKTADISASQQVMQMGEQGVAKLIEAIEGKAEFNANEHIKIAPVIVTAENVDDPALWANNVEEE